MSESAGCPASRCSLRTGRRAGLVSFRLGDPVRAVSYLREHDVIVRSIPETQSIRVSCAFFNTTDEIDRLVELLGEGA